MAEVNKLLKAKAEAEAKVKDYQLKRNGNLLLEVV